MSLATVKSQALLSTVVLLAGSVTANAQFDGMLSRIPDGVNAIMLVDADGVRNSPLAADNKSGSIPFPLPPDAESVVIGSQVDAATMKHLWQAGVVKLNSPAKMSTLAKAEGGHVEKIGKVDVVWSPFNVYFVNFESTLMGLLGPANRQYAVGWINQKGQWQTGNLSSYLKKATNEINTSYTHIVLAFDLTDALDPTRLEHRLGETKALQDAKVDLSAVAKKLASVEGVTVSVQHTKDLRGHIVFDFKEDISVLQDYAKPLVMEILNDHGLVLKDFDNWGVSISGNQALMSGALSDTGLSLIVSLLEMPLPAQTPHVTSTDAGDQVEELPMPQATQQFFKSMTNLLQPVFDHPQSATWMEKTSRRISRLPVLNVDPDLLDCSRQVIDLLSQGSEAMTDSIYQANTRMAKIQPDSGYYVRGVSYTYGGYYGYGYKSSNYGKRQAIRAEEHGDAVEKMTDLQRQIQDLTAQAKDKMSGRYHLAF